MSAADQSKPLPRALIVDDERGIRSSMAGVLSDEGWQAIVAESGREGVQKFVAHKPDLVFLDIWMEGMDGIKALQMMRQYDRHTPIVMMSGHGTIETAVKTTKLGAYDFLEKPLSIDKILPLLEQVASRTRQQEQGKSAQHPHDQAIIGDSEPMERIKTQITRVAGKNVWVLITGENGTGKEVVAQAIHRQSLRADFPFVAVNCAAIPDDLIESELFGYVKGAFTNAVSNKKGRFEAAHKGTLFLDEIGDMSLRTQSKVLRILQEQRFEPLGSNQSVSVDVRVIAATNKNLKEQIAEGNFREDLFYRLNVIPFHLPPLRERGEDVVQLAEFFLGQYTLELGEPAKSFSQDAKTLLKSHPWPGNVRELKNLVERLSIMVPGAVIDGTEMTQYLPKAEDKDAKGQGSIESSFLQRTFKDAKLEFEKTYIVEKLKENNWNISKTAETIGIERSNLHKKIKAYGIVQPQH